MAGKVDNNITPAKVPVNLNRSNGPLTEAFSNVINIRPAVLFLNSFPPRQCGLATYSEDLIKAMENKFTETLAIKICAVETDAERQAINTRIQFKINTDHPESFLELAKEINSDASVRLLMLQHEFGLFKKCEAQFLQFLDTIAAPIITVFHTVLPHPDKNLKSHVRDIASLSDQLVVMTRSSADILSRDYDINSNKISVIPHGTHLVEHSDRGYLKNEYNISGKTILATFGLISSGKGIEMTLEALPAIIAKNKNVLFLIIGKTHPGVILHEGEKYRKMLEEKVALLHLEKHVAFINSFLSLPELLNYLQLTDIYLFTSKDPNQAVSGTFSYALSCGCPIVTTPIPHAVELIKNGAALAVDFENSKQLSEIVIKLLDDEAQRKRLSQNALHKMAPTAWENCAISYTELFQRTCHNLFTIKYSIPEINLNHIKKLTTNFGMVQFSEMNIPDIASGYTLDDNARALIAMCQHYKLTQDREDLDYITRYFNFVHFCLQPDGTFLNYVDSERRFSGQNFDTNLDDSNGRAIWSLGYTVSIGSMLPPAIQATAHTIILKALPNLLKITSPRALGFIIKGLCYYNEGYPHKSILLHIKTLADRLVRMYLDTCKKDWHWFEDCLTYGNSVLPEALLWAWKATNNSVYRQIAKASFCFLLSKTLTTNSMMAISNKGWLQNIEKNNTQGKGGEQPIDIAYTIFALHQFHKSFSEGGYGSKLSLAFSWFLGNNQLHQIVYNPRTGGCYDGLEDSYVNLNQGAESSVCYLMARLTIQEYLQNKLQSDKNNSRARLNIPTEYLK